MTDWKLISQGLLGIYWIHASNKIENADKTLQELYGKDFNQLWKGERLLNNGVLMMASYLLFVIPQQADFNNIDFSVIDTSKFKILHQDSDHSDKKKFCRRLRNSIAHVRYTIDSCNNKISFTDCTTQGTDKIEFEIGSVDFVEFIDNFSQIVNQQIINK